MTEFETITGETVDVGLIQSFIQELPEKALRFGVRVLLALLVFVIGAQLIKLVCKVLKKSMQRGNADVGVIQFLSSFVRISLYVLPGTEMKEPSWKSRFSIQNSRPPIIGWL